MVKWATDGLLQGNDGKMLVNDVEMIVNDSEMLVNDGEMSIWSYTHFTIINEYFTIMYRLKYVFFNCNNLQERAMYYGMWLVIWYHFK